MTQPDQSIEDILASIKRIIVEEGGTPAPGPDPVHGPATADDDVLELTQPLPPEVPAPAVEPPATLVSAVTAGASRQALASLSGLKLPSGDVADDTLAGLVRELLKPLLKDWLDAHLPAVVERAVIQEIARLQATRG